MTNDSRTRRRCGRLACLLTRYDMVVGCVNCGHREFVILRRGRRDAYGTQNDRDVERCERCNAARIL